MVPYWMGLDSNHGKASQGCCVKLILLDVLYYMLIKHVPSQMRIAEKLIKCHLPQNTVGKIR